MITKKYEKSIYLDVSTFTNLRENGEILVNHLEYILHNYMISTNCSLEMYTEKLNGREKVYLFNEKNWINVCRYILNGELLHFVVRKKFDEKVDHQYFTNPMALGITFDYKYELLLMEVEKNPCNNIAFSVGERLLQHPIPLDIQNKWVDLFIRIFKEMNGVNGFMNIGYQTASISPNTTKLEGLHRLHYGIHSENFNKVARGYFWGNILSEGHIERLGGVEIFLKNVPCHRVEELNFGNRRAIYFQLSPDINNYSDDQLRALKNFLKPILPEEDIEMVLKEDPTGVLRKNARLIFD